jgi:spore coat protein F
LHKQGFHRISLLSLFHQKLMKLCRIPRRFQFYPSAPHPGESSEYRITDSFLAGDLLAFAKTAVRNYAVAITETATPALRAVLQKQLNLAINSHGRIYSYMYANGLYPSYNLSKLLQKDMMLARNAISM